ncbi:MAG: 50S ribosomal protein L4 [Candidatus Levybacteria bacterium]|nr:50S ribosomal protein L4 [Candidatus Levybacteria bacterium]
MATTKTSPVLAKGQSSSGRKEVAVKKTAPSVEESMVKNTPAKAGVASEAKVKLTANSFDITGKALTAVKLPEEIFGAAVNKPLIAQAIRIYLANQRQGTVRTKSRGEVHGSSRKIYRQKGTGRARHGGVRAPIFVGGGVAHGPKPVDHSRTMPTKMRRAALFSVLSEKQQLGSITVIEGLEKIEAKTKAFVQMLAKTSLADKKQKILVVLPGTLENAQKASRNIKGVTYVHAKQLNSYDALNAKTIILGKDAIGVMEEAFVAKK